MGLGGGNRLGGLSWWNKFVVRQRDKIYAAYEMSIFWFLRGQSCFGGNQVQLFTTNLWVPILVVEFKCLCSALYEAGPTVTNVHSSKLDKKTPNRW